MVQEIVEEPAPWPSHNVRTRGDAIKQRTVKLLKERKRAAENADDDQRAAGNDDPWVIIAGKQKNCHIRISFWDQVPKWARS